MNLIKVTIAILFPWVSIYLGDLIYGSSHLISHPPCEKVYLGCFKINFASFALKGLLCGSVIGIISTSKTIWSSGIVSGLFLLVFLSIRLSGMHFESFIYLLGSPYYWLELPIPFIFFSYLGFVIARHVKRKVNISLGK